MGYVVLLLEEEYVKKLVNLSEKVLGERINYKVVNVPDDVVKGDEFTVGQRKNESKSDIRDGIVELLHNIGMPTRCKGYGYIIDAIMFRIENPEKARSITKQLYPYVAEVNHTEPYRVERNIRNAIEIVCSYKDSREKIKNIFGYTRIEEKHKITNSEFLSMVEERVRMVYKL